MEIEQLRAQFDHAAQAGSRAINAAQSINAAQTGIQQSRTTKADVWDPNARWGERWGTTSPGASNRNTPAGREPA